MWLGIGRDWCVVSGRNGGRMGRVVLRTEDIFSLALYTKRPGKCWAFVGASEHISFVRSRGVVLWGWGAWGMVPGRVGMLGG